MNFGHNPRQRTARATRQERATVPAFDSLVVMAVDSMLRRGTGRKFDASDFTTSHLSGRSVRVLAFRLRHPPSLKLWGTGDYGGQVGLALEIRNPDDPPSPRL
jgi:hypothetical protein